MVKLAHDEPQRLTQERLDFAEALATQAERNERRANLVALALCLSALALLVGVCWIF